MMEATRKEASKVEFTLICPTDGSIQLGLEDISAVVFHGTDSIEVVFECPHCQASLRAELLVPNLLGAALELAQFADDKGDQSAPEIRRHAAPDDEQLEFEWNDELLAQREREAEPYCEYFRRQLSRIETAEDLLAEFE
jgi:hypothetical protein